LGVSQDFTSLIQQSGGQVFEEKDIEAIKKSVRDHAVTTEVKTTSWAWIPLTVALVLFILEIVARRIGDTRR
ncbi:MAG: hypothetical protein AABX51_06260, partial [Nanoarchaeota archaeon]